jgi:hypothetical protein
MKETWGVTADAVGGHGQGLAARQAEGLGRRRRVQRRFPAGRPAAIFASDTA